VTKPQTTKHPHYRSDTYHSVKMLSRWLPLVKDDSTQAATLATGIFVLH